MVSDLTGNNVIEWRDFQTLIDAIGAVRGVGGEDHLAARLSLTDVWQAMTATVRKDTTDKITLVDWIRMWADSLTAEKEPAWQKAYLDYMFHLLDASGENFAKTLTSCTLSQYVTAHPISGDQLVDLAEYIEVLGYFSIPREEAIYCFDKFAVNSAGGQCNSIDHKRFVDLWQQYFWSNDVNDVGNYLLGTV
ncbi:unnamed protein product [Angiostrongylus costaricensis]|uniref:Sarcoplasmic calcium-binding proteins I, III, and IV n=1 Tax=Angiostrongylus costaricensis TaxID=334426 RepID=A0A0R3PEE7_ANGCS|nr:unnamed protein product [Angiostrongylus costaricensis]